MKRFFMIIILILMCISISVAGEKTFTWDQNTESDLKGYKAYRSVASSVQAIPSNLWLTIWKPNENPDPANPAFAEYIVNTENDCELARNVLPDGTHYFVWTAFDIAGNESGTSNEVSTTIDDTAPAPPTGLQCFVGSSGE